MNDDVFNEIAEVLKDQFEVDASRVRPEALLEDLGLDSLAVTEFVFAVEDHFSVRLPEEKLDPRRSGVTLAQLAALLEDELAVPPASSSRTA